MNGSIVLGDVAKRAQVLAIACSRCDRAGRYPVATLIVHHGALIPIPRLLRRLSADCPNRAADTHDGPCGVHCPEIPTLFGVDLREKR